jgi:hypothetical protein
MHSLVGSGNVYDIFKTSYSKVDHKLVLAKFATGVLNLFDVNADVDDNDTMESAAGKLCDILEREILPSTGGTADELASKPRAKNLVRLTKSGYFYVRVKADDYYEITLQACEKPGITGNVITEIKYEQRDDGVWLCYWDKGLMHYDAKVSANGLVDLAELLQQMCTAK